MNIQQAITVLRTGLTTFDEQHEIAALLEKLEVDANRYRWMNKYISRILMVTEKQTDSVVDRATGRVE